MHKALEFTDHAWKLIHICKHRSKEEGKPMDKLSAPAGANSDMGYTYSQQPPQPPQPPGECLDVRHVKEHCAVCMLIVCGERRDAFWVGLPVCFG